MILLTDHFMPGSNINPNNSGTLSTLFLQGLIRDACQTRCNPLVREGSVNLSHRFAALGGVYYSKLSGGLNQIEKGNLTLGKLRIEFSRKGYCGDWTLDGKREGRNVISAPRRWLYWGQSVTKMNDGTTIQVKMPILGPSTKQTRDCICVATLQNDKRVRMFLARPDDQIQLIFDPSESHILDQLTEATRAVLLGEYLRIRSNYTFD